MSKKDTRIRRRGQPTRSEERDARKAEAEAALPEKKERRRTPVVPSAPTAPPTSVDTEALMAIANMNPEDLAQLMEMSSAGLSWTVGDKITGTVSRVTQQEILVDIGGKGEAALPIAELAQEIPSPGDTIEAFVTWVSAPDVGLSQKLASGGLDALEAAHQSALPVEGKVVSKNSGGFEVLFGSHRAFCPISQISRLREVDLDAYVGQELTFRVIEVSPKLVVSRRVLQEEEVARSAEAFWLDVAVGQVYGGVVRNVQPFGVFVDIQGVDGLVPKRELGWSGSEISVTPGQSLEVRVLEVDKDARKLTLSAKDPDLSPWNRVGTDFEVGGIYSGTVTKTAEFGAFIRLAPGLEGLAHVSRFPAGLPSAGEVLDVRIMDIEHDRQRLALSPAIGGEVADDAPDTELHGVVRDVKHAGVSIQLDDGRTGWLAASEVELPAGTVLAQRFRRGRGVTARVLSVDGSQVKLTQRTRTEDRTWRRELASANQASEGFGTMAALLAGLKDKLDG